MDELGVHAKKGLGQHFLVEPKYVRIALDAAELTSDDHVLEVGGGLGVLSIPLSHMAGKLTIIERDPMLADFLISQFEEDSNVQVVKGDALRIDLPRVDKCVSNIPYQISSPLLERLISADVGLSVLMIQKEFAERMEERPGSSDYSRLSLKASVLDVKTICRVPPRAFLPPPRVDSALVRWVINTERMSRWRELVSAEDFARLLFSMKNKTIGAIVSTRLSKARRRQAINIASEDLKLPEEIKRIRPRNLGFDEFEQVVCEMQTRLAEVDTEWHSWFFPTD